MSRLSIWIMIFGIVVISVVLLFYVHTIQTRTPQVQLTEPQLIWEAATEYNLYSVAFSPDGKMIATGGGGQKQQDSQESVAELRLWDAEDGKPISSLSGHNDIVSTAEFSLDGKTIASGDFDGKIILRGTESRKILSQIDKHTGYHVVFSPDGSLLAAKSGSKVSVWETGSMNPKWEKVNDGFGGLAFSPDSETLACAHKDKLILWDARTGNIKHTFGDSYILPGGAFSPDGKTLIIFKGYFIELLDAHTLRIRKKIHWIRKIENSRIYDMGGAFPGSINSLVFSPDSKIFALSITYSPGLRHLGNTSVAYLWDAHTGQMIKSIRISDPSIIYSGDIAFSPDGTKIAIGAGNKLALWQIR